ncbi:type I secretion system permease/ATPase [Mesorhizobium sp. KR9-304]|uniref:type I secretion system permease/ATPase n=1 Tax=Mesorhizobium sp. KR9-304 TaxID=3156614 RepID=UPI0032B31717
MEQRHRFFGGSADPEPGPGPGAFDVHDPLLAALEYLAGHHDRPFSAAAVLQGLPLQGGLLTLDLFARGAERLGFEAKIVDRRPSEVSGLVCPFIVPLKSGDVAIVLEKRHRSRRASVIVPGVSDVKKMRLSELDRMGTDIVIYVADRRQQEAVASDAAMMRRMKGHWLWSVVWRLWPTWNYVVLAALVINLLGLALPLFVMNVYDRVIPNNSVATLWALAAGVAIALGADFVLRMLRAGVIENSGRRVDMKVSAALFEQALDATMASRAARAGEFANHIREFEQVRDFFTSSSIVSVIDLLFIGVFLGLLYMIVGELALVPLIAVPVVLAATLLIQIPLSRSVNAAQLTKTSRHTILVESMVSIETVKAVAGESVLQKRWEDAVAGSVRASSSMRFWSSLAMYFTMLVQQGVSVVLIVWGVYLVGAGSITIGALIASNILAGRVLAPLGSIAMTLARAQTSFSALRQLNQMMRLDRDHKAPPSGGGRIDQGRLEIRDLEFAYRGQQAKALDGLSLRIAPGERVGIVGRVASGKSTLGKLLCGLYTADNGAVIIDGTDVRHCWMADLRKAVAYVGQEPELFAGTLRENILFGKQGDDKAFEEAARASGIASLAQSHPLGYALPVGERGRAISGGQRQAVAIARALLGKPRVLFLDEPTSAMDNLTEAAFIRSFRNWLKPDVTLILSTHRVSMLELVDRLVVLENGRVAADGPKDKVLASLLKRKLVAPNGQSDGQAGDRPVGTEGADG